MRSLSHIKLIRDGSSLESSFDKISSIHDHDLQSTELDMTSINYITISEAKILLNAIRYQKSTTFTLIDIRWSILKQLMVWKLPKNLMVQSVLAPEKDPDSGRYQEESRVSLTECIQRIGTKSLQSPSHFLNEKTLSSFLRNIQIHSHSEEDSYMLDFWQSYISFVITTIEHVRFEIQGIIAAIKTFTQHYSLKKDTCEKAVDEINYGLYEPLISLANIVIFRSESLLKKQETDINKFISYRIYDLLAAIERSRNLVFSIENISTMITADFKEIWQAKNSLEKTSPIFIDQCELLSRLQQFDQLRQILEHRIDESHTLRSHLTEDLDKAILKWRNCLPRTIRTELESKAYSLFFDKKYQWPELDQLQLISGSVVIFEHDSSQQHQDIHQPTILVAEDETMLLDSISLFLHEEGYRVIEAKDGQEAIEKFHNNHIDAVVTDIHMPNKTGDELINEILQISIIPIIVFTGYSSIQPHYLRNLGVADVIAKPIDLDQLCCIVNSHFKSAVPVQKNEVNSIKLLEKKFKDGSIAENIKIGRDGFFLKGEFPAYSPKDIIHYSIKHDHDKYPPLEGTALVYWNSIHSKKDDPTIAPGIMLEFKDFSDHGDEFRRWLEDNPIKASIPLIFLDQGEQDAA